MNYTLLSEVGQIEKLSDDSNFVCEFHLFHSFQENCKVNSYIKTTIAALNFVRCEFTFLKNYNILILLKWNT